ncbi:MAG TPA: S-layer homology domain-containing protein [Leptolyngbyaceae cyanobacterium]
MVSPKSPEPPSSRKKLALKLRQWTTVISALLTISCILLWALTRRTEVLIDKSIVQEPGQQRNETLGQPADFYDPPQANPAKDELSSAVQLSQPPNSTGPISVPPPQLPRPSSIGVSQNAVRQTPVAFKDVPLGHWVKPIVDDLSASQWIVGFPDHTFRPEASMTRAELAAQITRFFALPPKVTTLQFGDVLPDHWAASSIRKAVQMGFLTGLPEGTFAPDQPVTKVEVISAIATGLNLTSTSAPSRVLSRYQDQDTLPAWAMPSLVAATEAGLVVNYPDVTRLEPNRSATRAEVAAMMHYALVYLGEADKVPSPYQVQP